MQYRVLAQSFERLEATPGRLEMTSILVELLGKVPPGEMTAVVRLLQGAVAPDWEGLEVGLAEKQILKAIALATGAGTKSEAGLKAIEEAYHARGDLGLAAEALLGAGGGKKQASLFASSQLTVAQVFETVTAIARTTGAGSQEGKQRLLAKLLLDASPLEARYITRTVAGRLRLGVADMTFLDALAAQHLGKGVMSVQEMEGTHRSDLLAVRQALERAYDLQSDLAAVATALAKGGMEAVRALGIELGRPVRPMAAERLKTMPEILERMGGKVSLEYKYDGLRIQAHVPAERSRPVRLFSRRLEELTAQFPDVVANLRSHFKGKDCIVEGEAVALDEKGRMRPFQDLSRRRGRKGDVAEVAKELPVTMFLFDLLAEGGESRMEKPLRERRAQLEGMVKDDGPVRMSAQRTVDSVAAMERFFDEAVEEGAEGMMCKDPEAPYKAGSRGYAWIKFKTDYTEALVDTMDLVAIGAFYGRGRRGGWYGALLMAAYDPDTQTWPSVCKLGTGFDDATLMGLKERFKDQVAPAKPAEVDSEMEPDVWLHPTTVMEVQAAELTLSPIHRAAWNKFRPGAGLAARFPRFTGKWREDKSPEQATSVRELASMYKAE